MHFLNQKSTSSLYKALVIAGGTAVISLTASVVATPPAQACSVLEKLLIGCTPKPQYSYKVTVQNPVTGGMETRVFQNQAEAVRFKEQAESPRWVEWQFVGVNKPVHRKQFATQYQAESFVNNKDYCPDKLILGRTCVMKQTRILAPVVTFNTQPL